MKNIAVVLSGCGVYDGSEIQEAVLTLLAIDRAGAKGRCYAPEVQQKHVLDHMTGEEMKERRSVLKEAARICRGEIQPLAELDCSSVDALILPGGFGAAKNLCDYAFNGSDCTVLEQLSSVLDELQSQGKPLGALCIAPVIMAKIFGHKGVELTIGSDEKTASDLKKMGAKHVECSAEDCHVDEKLKIVSTPC